MSGTDQNKAISPIEIADARNRSRITGFTAFVAIICSAVIGLFLYPKILIERVKDWARNDPDKLSETTDFFKSYDCNNSAEFQQMLLDHSTVTKKLVFENGFWVEKTTYVRDAYATLAEQKYDQLIGVILETPSDYVVLNYTEIGIMVAIPVVFIILFLIYHHKYKVLKRRESW